MADKKISALTAASTPLAGTEILPIVQSGSTVKVPVSDLTAGRNIDGLGLTLTSTTNANTDANMVVLNKNISNSKAYLKVSDTSSSSTAAIAVDRNGYDARFHFYLTDTSGTLNEVFNCYGDTGNITVNKGNLSITGTIKGGTTIGVGNATPSTSGSGITFPAAQSASSNANTLDDYEEGTFTPAWNTGATTTAASGRYVKIGGQVTAYIYIVAGQGTAPPTDYLILQLPFASGNSSNLSNSRVAITTGMQYYWDVAPVAAFAANNSTNCYFWNTNTDYLVCSALGASGTFLEFTITYNTF